nr:anti-sigma factor [uncultured Cupriavidus sp.]
MNTSAASPDDDLRCAEYVLGVLDSAERRQVSNELLRNPGMAQSVMRWQQLVNPLSEDVHATVPPAHVWTRIQSELGLKPMHARARAASTDRTGGIWGSLELWRWLGVGASSVALALGTVSVLLLHQLRSPAPRPLVASASYRVANLARPNGVVDWTATIDLQRANIVIVPANASRPTGNQATELWLIPPGEKPLSLGVIAADKPATLSLTQTAMARLVSGSALAVSLEPTGGSPTGQPTGPVIATGSVRET